MSRLNRRDYLIVKTAIENPEQFSPYLAANDRHQSQLYEYRNLVF